MPLTVFQAGFDTRYLVIEMGATGIGHIRYLADMVRPEIGVVLGVGTAHAGEFGGVENIAAAKGELVEALPAEGTAVLNLDDPRVAAMASRTQATVLGFTSARHADPDAPCRTGRGPGHQRRRQPGVRPRTCRREPHGPGQQQAASAPTTSPTSSPPQRPPTRPASPAARSRASLSAQSAASRWRMERTERPDGVTVINDAYNANPESMRAALRTLADLGRGRRTWAVLGAMLELGEDSIREHIAVGTQVVRLNISRLVVVGREARSLYVSAVNEGSWGDECVFAETADEAYELLQSRARTRRPGAVQVLEQRRAAPFGRSDSITPTCPDPRATTAELPNRHGRECAVIALLIGAGLALLLALVGTPLFIRLLVRKSYGQFIRDDGPTSHHTKRGTPTMGGTVVVGRCC